MLNAAEFKGALKRVAPLLAIAAAGLAVYASSLTYPFHFDDNPRIVQNPAIHSLWPPTETMATSNRPFGDYTFAINYAIGGDRPWGYRLVNVGLHICAGLCLYGIVRRTLTRSGGPLAKYAVGSALTAALLWTVHPINTQAVTYIVQRLESLMGLSYLATLYFFIRAQDSDRPGRWYAASVVACAFGMGCKEVMATAPLIVLWYDRAFVASTWKEILNRRWYYLALAGTWGVLAWGTLHVTKDYSSGVLLSVDGLTPWTYLLSQSDVLAHYLRLCFWPQGQNFDYGWPAAQSLRDVLPQGLLIPLLLALTIWCIFRRPKLGFLGAWFFLILAPTSSVIPIYDLAVEHRMYLPSAAVIILVVIGSVDLWAKLPDQLRWSGSALAIACVAIATAALAATSIARNEVYSSTLSLWSDVASKSPHNCRAYIELAKGRFQAGHLDDAVRCARLAVEADSENVLARTNLATLLTERGEKTEAIELIEGVLRDAPDYPNGRLAAGRIFLRFGYLDEAIRQFETALELDPDHIAAAIELATVLNARGDVRTAERLSLHALEVDPRFIPARLSLAFAIASRGRTNDALDLLRETKRIDPDNADVCLISALVVAPSDPEQARSHLREAIRLDPESAPIRAEMGKLLATSDPKRAIEHFEAALKLRADFPEALFNLSLAWLALDRSDKAIEYLERAVELRPEWDAAQQNLRILRQRTQAPAEDPADRAHQGAGVAGSAEEPSGG